VVAEKRVRVEDQDGGSTVVVVSLDFGGAVAEDIDGESSDVGNKRARSFSSSECSDAGDDGAGEVLLLSMYCVRSCHRARSRWVALMGRFSVGVPGFVPVSVGHMLDVEASEDVGSVMRTSDSCGFVASRESDVHAMYPVCGKEEEANMPCQDVVEDRVVISCTPIV
jgi:hypothetical protein